MLPPKTDQIIHEPYRTVAGINSIPQLVSAAKRADNFKRWRENPLLWLEERFGENPKTVAWNLWGKEYESHVWDGDENPLLALWNSLARKDWAAITSATSIGKTYIGARIVFWFLDVYQDSLVVTTAPKLEQLKLQLWGEIKNSFHKFRKIRPNAILMASLKIIVDGKNVNLKDLHEDDFSRWMAVGFGAGVKADEQSTTKAQGFHRENMLILVEETPGVPGPTMTAFENTSTGSNNLILAMGNPDSATDTLSEFANNPKVKVFRASGLDHPNVVLNKEVIPGAVTIGSIQARKVKHGEDSFIYNTRVRGKVPMQSVDSLIRYEWIMSCLEGSLEYQKAGEIIDDGTSLNAVGVDVANSENGDKACLAWGKANTLYSIHDFNCANANDLGYNLIYDSAQLAQQGSLDYNTGTIHDAEVMGTAIGVDAAGLGIATVNVLNSAGYKCQSLTGGQVDDVIPLDNQGKKMYKFGNLRSQMYFALREDLQNRAFKIAIADKAKVKQLIKELTIPTFVQGNGAINVQPKQEIKKKLGGKSPDIADSVVYWNWIRRGTYYTNTITIPIVALEYPK